MPRAPRIHYPGATYHVMARGVDGRDVYIDEEDRRRFLQSLARLRKESPFSIIAYCLMGNHFHLAVQVADSPLSGLMRRLLTSYVMTFNRRHDRTGHLFQARYKSILCQNDTYLLALVRYIHMNPVRARFTTDPAEWPWSSHRQYLGGAPWTFLNTEIVFRALQGMQFDEEESFSRWCTQVDPDFEPWPKSIENEKSNTKEAPHRDKPSLDELASRVFDRSQIEAIRSRVRSRSISGLRTQLVKTAFGYGWSLVEIGRWLGRSTPTVHYLLKQ